LLAFLFLQFLSGLSALGAERQPDTCYQQLLKNFTQNYQDLHRNPYETTPTCSSSDTVIAFTMINPAAFFALWAYTCSVILQLPGDFPGSHTRPLRPKYWLRNTTLPSSHFSCRGWHAQHHTTSAIVRRHLPFKPYLPSSSPSFPSMSPAAASLPVAPAKYQPPPGVSWLASIFLIRLWAVDTAQYLDISR
jgi:hypothetical protein